MKSYKEVKKAFYEAKEEYMSLLNIIEKDTSQWKIRVLRNVTDRDYPVTEDMAHRMFDDFDEILGLMKNTLFQLPLKNTLWNTMSSWMNIIVMWIDRPTAIERQTIEYIHDQFENDMNEDLEREIGQSLEEFFGDDNECGEEYDEFEDFMEEMEEIEDLEALKDLPDLDTELDELEFDC